MIKKYEYEYKVEVQASDMEEAEKYIRARIEAGLKHPDGLPGTITEKDKIRGSQEPEGH